MADTASPPEGTSTIPLWLVVPPEVGYALTVTVQPFLGVGSTCAISATIAQVSRFGSLEFTVLPTM